MTAPVPDVPGQEQPSTAEDHGPAPDGRDGHGPPGPLLRLDAVVLRVEEPVPTHIFGPLDVCAHRGESVAIVGPSGAGKSSLVLVIGGMVPPSSGRYTFDGADVGTMSRHERARFRSERLGFVFQAANLIDDRSALENVAMGLWALDVPARERRTRALAQLERVGLGPIAHRPARLLSGGERQRVAVARAMVKQPELIIADEPTGSLDTRTGASVLDLLFTVVDAGTTLLLVTHDRAAASRAARELTIVDGRIGAEHAVAH